MQWQDDTSASPTRELFDRASELKTDERAEFLATACAHDPDLKLRLERMLAADSKPHPSWKGAALEAFARGGPVEAPPDYTERSFGPYRILERIGSGGMGVVYKAVREDNEYRQTVAIKILPGGFDTRDRVERFRHERQILANLVHPYIARLLDGGTTEDGLPYLVLEFVEGLPLDRFVRQRALPLADRLHLFRRVADAVQFSHRNLVVHCDLKPANILVEPDGTPKLLDFGISQLLEEGRLSRTATAPLMTPEYASPEQVLAKPITTATDVYALGVLLYVLLTGRRPYDTETKSGSRAEVARAVCERALDSTGLAEDLRNIVAMATRKEPERRYGSAEQLSADVGNFLEYRPVQARPDTFGYRARKYGRRHRVGLGAAGLVAASVVAGVILILSQARDARDARAVAEDRSRQADAARQVAEREHTLAEKQRTLAEQSAGIATSAQGRAEERLTDMVQLANKSLFEVQTSIQKLAGATQVRRDIINTTLEYLKSLEKESGDDPRLQLALGSAYFRVAELLGDDNVANLGDTAGAFKNLDRAAAWVAPLRAKRAPDAQVLSLWVDIAKLRGDILEAMGQSANSVKVLRAALPDAVLLGKMSADDGREARLHESLANAVIDYDPPGSVEEAKLAIAQLERLLARHPDDSGIELTLSSAHADWGRAVRTIDAAGGLAQYRETARLREDVVARHPNDAAARRNLMVAYGHIASLLGDAFYPLNVHDVEGARMYYTRAAVIAHDLALADPVNTVAQYDVAAVEMRLGALDPKPGAEAESLAALERARIVYEHLLASDPERMDYQTGLGIDYRYIGNRRAATGNYAEALAARQKGLAVADHLLITRPGNSTGMTLAMSLEDSIALMMAAQGDRSGALDYARRTMERVERSKGLNEPAFWIHLRFAIAWATTANVRRELGDWAEARSAAVLSVAEWRVVASSSGGDSREKDRARMERVIAECDEHLK